MGLQIPTKYSGMHNVDNKLHSRLQIFLQVEITKNKFIKLFYLNNTFFTTYI